MNKICGDRLASIFNLASALVSCLVAGAMITVSATAVGLPFDIPMPGLEDWLPTSVGWIIKVFIVGSVITVVAIAGWTTCNPTIYRAGLAFQTITPGWKRWKITLFMGIFTTFLACFLH